MEDKRRQELIKKYQWAGKIRFVSFLLLFLFLLLMKLAGGYSYLNIFLISLIFAEAVLNQPYKFYLDKVDVYRFQFYQMITDIIAISWVAYYMGGIEAPVISIAYYAVILWAGVVSGQRAVFFAVISSCVLFSSAVLLGHFGIFPSVSYLKYEITDTQMFSLLLGNVAFLFAFGYFSAHSSMMIKSLEKKRFEEALKSRHKLLATGYLFGGIAHDVINHLASVRGYTTILLEKIGQEKYTDKGLSSIQMLESIHNLESENMELLSKLSMFSLKHKERLQPADLREIINEALSLTSPFAQMSGILIEHISEKGPLLIVTDKGQIQEALVTLIINIIEAMPAKGKITVRTSFIDEDNCAQVILQGGGLSLEEDYLKKVSGPLFTTDSQPDAQGRGLGFVIAQEIIARHKGKLDIKNLPGERASVVIRLPAA